MKLHSHIVPAIMVLFSLACGRVVADGIAIPNIGKSSKILFSSFTNIDVRIEAPLNQLILKKGDILGVKKLRVSGHLFTDGKDIPIEIKLRGFSTLYFCDFPKFTVFLDEAFTAGTVFEKIKKVDVGTHCSPNAKIQATVGAGPFFSLMKFNHREALIYKWLEILEIPSYAARPANMTYKDTSVASPIEIKEQGFFIENLDGFLKRSDGIEIRTVSDSMHIDKVDDPHPKFKKLYTGLDNNNQLDRSQLARISFFNAFIGNTDSRLNDQEIWNLKLIELKNGTWFPTPMDFNLASIVIGPVTRPMFYNPMYRYADKELTLQILNSYIAKMPELLNSLSAIQDDAEGFKNFQDSLRTRAIELENLRNQMTADN